AREGPRIRHAKAEHGAMTGTGEVPFVDLVTPHRELEEELVSVFRSALKTAGFVGGPIVEGLEHDFAQFCGVRHCVGVGSGTDALRVALIAAGVQTGDTVVTVPNTFIATTEAISQAGARTDFVDIDERTYTMDPEKLRSYLEIECVRVPQTNRVVSQRTGSPVTAVIPVHLYGQMADMDAIQAGILRLKLKHLDTWNRQRRENADRYQDLFRPMAGSVITPYEADWARAVYHLYVIRTENRDRLRQDLAEAGIATGIHYPIPLHLQRAYRHLGRKE